MTFRHLIFHQDNRNLGFMPLVGLASAIAVRPDSTPLPVAVTLAILLVYAPFLFRSDQPHRSIYIALTCLSLAVGNLVSRYHAAQNALSTSTLSLVILFIISTISSSIVLGTVFIATKFHAFRKSSWSQITLFPAIWATVWCAISYISPVGHLSTWSIAKASDAYRWILPIGGPVSIDWIVAAWAVVLAQAVGHWYMGERDPEHEIDLLNPQDRSLEDNTSAVGLLVMVLVALTIPSFMWTDLPLPASLSTIDVSTPISLGCVLPPFERYKHHILTLDDYIAETKRVLSSANIFLWPEGAVTFHSAEEREGAFQKIRDKINDPTKLLGVSFEDVVEDPSDPAGRKSLSRTGIALISSKSNDTYLTYYKRHLVPLAESFSLRHSDIPPEIYEFSLPPPKNVKSGDWAPAPNKSRPIPVTTSICLDFAMPSPFAELSSRPALILAPARTWDITVGHAMWLQAKQRAAELDATVLWCDGGEGGVSGVAGRGYNDVYQVGSGSFTRNIGIQYPFDPRPTFFARIGDSVLILFWISALGLGFLRGSILRNALPPIPGFIRRLRDKGNRPQPNADTQPNLLDF